MKEPDKNKNFDELSDEEKIEALVASLEDEVNQKEEKNAAKEFKEPKQKPSENPASKLSQKLKEKSPGPFKKKKKPGLIMIQIGGAFHKNFYVNLLLTYFINLTLILTLLTLLGLGRFPDTIWIPLTFTFAYTVSEYLYRELMMLHYAVLVLRSFGFILYLGYVTLFYLIDQFVFSSYQIFSGEAEVAAFTGLFMIIRYLSTYVVKKGLEFKL